MANKIITGLASFLATACIIVLYFVFSARQAPESYYFDRAFLPQIRVETAAIPKFNEDNFTNVVASKAVIASLDYLANEEGAYRYKLHYTGLDFKNKRAVHLEIPENSNVLWSDQKQVLYTYEYNLYKYDVQSGLSSQVKIDGLKVRHIKDIRGEDSAFICFGEILRGDRYTVGFFKIDIRQARVTAVVKEVEEQATSEPAKIFLKYAGKFSSEEGAGADKFAFYCNKNSTVYIFNGDGSFYREFNTYDNTPAPTVISNSNGIYFYKRGETWTTNSAAFIQGERLYVFSTRSQIRDALLLDVYSLTKGEYLHSRKITYKNKSNKDLGYAYYNSPNLTLAFNDSYTAFNFSRYIK